MRSTLITSVLAASVLSVGVAANAGAAVSGEAENVASPTSVPFDIGGLNLTPEQMSCLMGSVMNVDLQDMAAIMDLMSQCGIDPMDLLAGATTVPGVPTTMAVVPGGGPDAAAAAAVLAMLGVDATAAQCIEDGLLGAVSPGDDNEALVILQDCGLTLNGLLTGLVAVDALSAGGVDAVTTVPGSPTTASGTTNSPLVQQLIDTVEQQYGITLAPEQASCLLENIATIDPEDMTAMLGLMEQCGISLTDLAPS